MTFDYETVLVIGEFEGVCRVLTGLDQEAVVFAADEGLVGVIPGRGDYFGEEVAGELSRILRTGAIGWIVEDGAGVVATVYQRGEELLEFVSNPTPPSGGEEAPAASGTVLGPSGVDPGLFAPFGTDRMDLDALHAALVGGPRESGAPWADAASWHALIMAALGHDPAPFALTLDQAIAADLPGARYLAASDCASPAD